MPPHKAEEIINYATVQMWDEITPFDHALVAIIRDLQDRIKKLEAQNAAA